MALAASFYWYDYIILVSTLAVSTSIGIYFGCFGTRQNTVNEYLMGSKKIKMLPVALSVTISHVSAVTLTSVPADVYKYGAYYIFTCFSMALIAIITIFVYLPVFFNLQITSIYEYLEKRFDRKTRLLASFLYILYELCTSASMIYASSLNLSVAMGINFNVICLGTYFICLFYTAIGGLRTVIWTDLFQLIVIILSLIILIVIGVHLEGGVVPVWNKVFDGKRLDIFDFDLNPSRRDSFWIYIIGFTFHYTSFLTLSQTGMQKFLAVSSFRDCKWSVIFCAISMSFISVTCVSIGLLMYARYSHCDLLLSKKITRHEQMIAYYVLDTTKTIPGFSGLFAATICCASLSSISCNLNAIGGVIYKDFVSRFLSRNISEKKNTSIIKLTVMLIGLICPCIVLILQQAKEIYPFVLSFNAMILGPLAGMFTLGVLFPQATPTGAFFGAIGGAIAAGSIGIPKNYYQSRQNFQYPSKPLSTSGCESNFTLTNNFNITSNKMDMQNPTISFVFRISHLYICFVGTITTIILGLIISRMTTRNNFEVDEMLLSPFVRQIISKKSTKNRNVLKNLIDKKKSENDE